MSRPGTNAYTLHNKVKIIRGGADYFDCIESIARQARYTLHFQTYIFDEDDTGKKVADALIEAARRNVAVYLLVDGYASQGLSKHFIARLREAGVRFGFFHPLFKGRSFYIGRRMHHKVMVADGRYSLVAGINVSNRYNDIGGKSAWLDWAVYADGEVGRGLHLVCARIWNRSALRERCPKMHPSAPAPAALCEVRIRRNDWVFKKTQITRSFKDVFRTARSQVTIMTGYFWPPHRLMRQMERACRRGVKVRLILTSKADVPFSKYGERYLYPWLFRNNVEVYEYKENILHGKITVSDGTWLTAGSYNLNNISAYASVELNLEVRNDAVVKEVTAQLQQIIDDHCSRVTESDYRRSAGPLRRFFYYASYWIIHLIFFLFTFYFRQQTRAADRD